MIIKFKEEIVLMLKINDKITKSLYNKPMKKIIVIFLLFLMFIPACFAEDFPPKGGREEYPIYWYLMRHGEKLKKVLDHKKYFRLRGWDCCYIVKITKDGTVQPLEIIYSQNKYFDNQVKKIIETTKAEPFGDEINLDEMIIKIILGYSTWADYVDVWYGTNKIYTIAVSTIR